MKNVILTIAMLSAVSFTQTGMATTFCDGQKTMAEETMNFRQLGGSRSELDAIVYSEQGQAIADMAFARAVVPQSLRNTAVKGFGNHVKTLCEQSLSKQVADTQI